MGVFIQSGRRQSSKSINEACIKTGEFTLKLEENKRKMDIIFNNFKAFCDSFIDSNKLNCYDWINLIIFHGYLIDNIGFIPTFKEISLHYIKLRDSFIDFDEKYKSFNKYFKEICNFYSKYPKMEFYI